MNVLVVIFGGLDHEFLARWDCPNLRQAEWGKVVVDELWNDRDVATQITAQLITGKTWRENGVNDRKKNFYTYHNRRIRWLEEKVFRNMRRGAARRRRFYQAFGWLSIVSREFLKADLTCPTLFDRIPNSKAVYVPAYNPEPSWALDRNILDPRRYPDLGVEGALDLREKNFSWRRRKFMEALTQDPPCNLLMGQFQYIDSTQHLYLSYVEPPRMDEVEKAYRAMDAFAGEILAAARGRYERILFISDNGAARKKDFRPTHHNRPFYSINESLHITKNNLRDFHEHILSWVSAAGAPSRASRDDVVRCA
ncbi:MAG TPA: alkaline phosphatase family protein [Opitutaceae bacterium]